MMVKFGEVDVELGGKYLGTDLRESNDILDDRDALHARMAEDGYLLIRGLQKRENVLAARRVIFTEFEKAGVLEPGTDLMDAIPAKEPTGKSPLTMGRKGITHHPAVLNVLESKEIFDFFEMYFGKQAMTYDYKWMRAVHPPQFTGAHYDVVYMGRGTQDKLCTVWTPFGDVTLDMGSLALCVGSHNLPSFQKVRDTYGKMDVDRDRVGGWFENDPTKVVDTFGGKWQTTEFQAGDVLIFGMFTMHGSLANVSGRYRLSCDTRFQPADEPVDDRWIGENPKAHYQWFAEPDKVVDMKKARADWGV